MPNIRSVVNFKFRYLLKSFGNAPFRLLDVGAGNHSASRITSLFPACAYYGLDLSKDYNNGPEDFQVMKDFYELDLTKLDYSSIPDTYFDGIWMAHVIEHLPNGDAVLPLLLKKLKPGGYFYLEYPGERSTRLPSMHGTLNFSDDPTHVRLYSIPELGGIFLANHCEIIESGRRRNWYFILAMPARILARWIRGKRLIGNIFWDLLGFAEFIYARKNE
jgi:SAM-dependent methyltransferase